MKQTYGQNRSPHIYTKTSPLKTGNHITKTNSDSATILGIDLQLKALHQERENLKKKIHEIQSIQPRFKDLDETKENKEYMEKLTNELIANIEEKLEIKQSIKELAEITTNNEREMINLATNSKANSFSYSQKLELSEKIEKLAKSNIEMNEIKEKLLNTLLINEQQLSMLKSHVVSIIEEYLFIIFRFETKEIESKLELCQIKIQNLNLSLDLNKKIQKKDPKDDEYEVKNYSKISMKSLNRENIIGKENNLRENNFSTPKALSKKATSSQKKNPKKSQDIRTNFSQFAMSPNSLTKDKSLNSSNLKIKLSLLAEKSDSKKNSDKLLYDANSSIENQLKKEVTSKDKITENVTTSQFLSDKTDSSIIELTPRGIENQDNKCKKDPKVARIELKNVKSSSFASESSTKQNTDKTKTPSISSRYGNTKSGEIFESKDDILKLKKKIEVQDSKEINTFDLLRSLESLKCPNEINEPTEPKFINVEQNYNPDHHKFTRSNDNLKKNDSVIIDDCSILSHEMEIRNENSEKKISRNTNYDDPDTCIIESTVNENFNDLLSKSFHKEKIQSSITLNLNNALMMKESMDLDTNQSRSTNKYNQTNSKYTNLEMRNPLEESGFVEHEHLESANGSPVICKTSKSLFNTLPPSKYNNHASLCLHDDI